MVARGVKSIRPQAIPAVHPAVVRVKEVPHEAACSSSGVSDHQAHGTGRPTSSLDALVSPSVGVPSLRVNGSGAC